MKQSSFSLAKFFGILVVCILAAYAVVKPYRDNQVYSEFQIQRFAELPVQIGGRVTPIDSVARNVLLILSGRQKVKTAGPILTPSQWITDLVMRPELADDYPIFKIEFPEEIGLRGITTPIKRYYSFNALLPYSEELRRQYSEINTNAQLRSPYENQIADLNEGLLLYNRLMHSFHPVGAPGRLDRLLDEYRSFEAIVGSGRAELNKQQAGEPFDAQLLDQLLNYTSDYLDLSQRAYLQVVPPDESNSDELAKWNNVGTELLEVIQGDTVDEVAKLYASLTMAFRANDPTTYNQTLDSLWSALEKRVDHSLLKKAGFESLFNRIQPFFVSLSLYVLIFLLVCISWLFWTSTLQLSAYRLLIVAFVIHTVGLAARMYIQGRPPVTNIYSSAVFVGWGAVLLGIFIEKRFRNGAGSALAALIGFATLIIAHHLAMTGDTLEMMRAVLDSNFWLTTHVIIITFGYSAVFLAGAVAIAFTLTGLFSSKFDTEDARSLSAIVYGITAFGVLFSLVGTILGGIWADQSWGRFWGWDPKENGALMIVVIGAIYLHARWGGVCRERGLMAIAIFGNIVTAWSWFGTNMLPVGLHSYGRMDSAYKWLLIFIASQILFILLSLLPWKYWKSQFGQKQHRKERKRILTSAMKTEHNGE